MSFITQLGNWLRKISTSITSLSVSGRTITYTRHNGDTGTIQTQDTTYSDATQSAHGLMSASDKAKLDGVATGAEVNQNAYSYINVGNTTIAADGKTGTLELVAGSNVTLTPDATNDKVTIAATDTVYTHPTTSGNKHIPSGGQSMDSLIWDSAGTAKWGYPQKIATEVANANASRHIFFAYSGDDNRVVYNDKFQYNPSTDSLTVGKINGFTLTGIVTLDKGDHPAAGELSPVIAVTYKNTANSIAHSTYPIDYIGNDNTSNNYNTGIRLGSRDGTTILSAGESGSTFASVLQKYDDENLYLVADGSINLYTNCANNCSSYKGPITITNNTITADNFVGKISGHTVAADVPSNAVFTDTHYSGATTTSNGLVTTGDQTWAGAKTIANSSDTGWRITYGSGSSLQTMRFEIGSGHVNRGIWDNRLNKWVFHCDNSKCYVGGFSIEKAVPSNAKFTDTVYTHPTTAGNKHIPSGGSSGQFLKYSSSGTAVWASMSSSDVNAMPYPKTSSGVGQVWAASSTGKEFSLPSGGTWFYVINCFNPNSTSIGPKVGVASGGSKVTAKNTTDTRSHCWAIRIA